MDLWAEVQLNVFTSARVGEYIESTVRAGSGRGLHYRISVIRGRGRYQTEDNSCLMSSRTLPLQCFVRSAETLSSPCRSLRARKA